MRSAVQFPIPNPALTRGRVFSGGVAVIADSWYQAKTALDRMPIEWTISLEHAAFTTANMRESLLAALDRPGNVRANQGDVDAAFAKAARIVEGHGMATISAMVHAVSVSREGKVRLERVDVAHDTGFGLVNPLSPGKVVGM